MFHIDSDNTDSDPDYIPESDSESDYVPGTPEPEQFSLLSQTPRPSTSGITPTPSTSTESEVTPLNNSVTLNKQLGKKRVRYESTWKRNVEKKKRASGLEYTTKSGKIKPARSTGVNCGCKFRCFARISQNIKDDVLANFNKSCDKVTQDTYLCGLITTKQIQRRRPKTGLGKARAYSCEYMIKLGEFKTTVCKKAFCSLHGIGKARVERIVSCLQQKNHFPKENRGKHDNRPNKIPQNIIDTIDDHIKSIPSEQSHYSRSRNDNVRYLSPDLSIKRLHLLYLEKFEPDIYARLQNGEKCYPKVTYDYYRRHFLTKYKLSFGTPRSDTCQQYDMRENKMKIEKDPLLLADLKNRKYLHLRKSEEFYKELKLKMAEAEKDDTVETISFDFQQNLPLPAITSGDVFYKRQLWLYNFTICSAKLGRSFCYLYDESVGTKGQNEVISLVNHFIKNEVSREVKTLYIFSDNCSAQNKNYALTLLVPASV